MFASFVYPCLNGEQGVGEFLKAGRGVLPHELRTILTRYPRWLPHNLLYVLSKGADDFAGRLEPHLPRRIAHACPKHQRYRDEPWRRHPIRPDAPRPPVA